MGDRDHHIFFDNEIFDGDFLGMSQDLGPSGVAVAFFDIFQLFNNNPIDFLLIGKDRFQFGDQLNGFLVLLQDLFPFETG